MESYYVYNNDDSDKTHVNLLIACTQRVFYFRSEYADDTSLCLHKHVRLINSNGKLMRIVWSQLDGNKNESLLDREKMMMLIMITMVMIILNIDSIWNIETSWKVLAK